MNFNLKHVYMEANPEEMGSAGDVVDNTSTDNVEEGDASTVTNAWPDNWREQYAGGDEKKLAQLSRYSSPSAAFDGLIAAKTKLSSGEMRSTAPFPEKGTDAEKAAWREQNGIPATADGYKYDQSLSENDKAFVESLSKFAHEKNIPQSHANAFMGYLLNLEQSENEAMLQQDKQWEQEGEDKLRAEWGNEFRRNINLIGGLLDTAPAGVKDAIMGGRLADGMPIGSNPDVLRFFADLALQINPVSTLVPSSGDPGKGIQDRIEEIEKFMKTNSKEYYKDEKLQEEYRNLLDARTRFDKK